MWTDSHMICVVIVNSWYNCIEDEDDFWMHQILIQNVNIAHIFAYYLTNIILNIIYVLAKKILLKIDSKIEVEL